MSYQIGVVGSADRHPPGVQEAEIVGRKLAEKGCTVFTGGCTGIPYIAARAAQEEGATTIGVSPAINEDDHVDKYQYPVDHYDHIIYTGFGYKGRNTILVRSCDAVVSLSGGMGTLNELTVGYDERKVVGLLRGLPGAADEFEEILKRLKLQPRRVVSTADPEELVEMIVEELE
ncbi:MAG: LOG family protein [Candidatus Hadarchaeota archaeon]